MWLYYSKEHWRITIFRKMIKVRLKSGCVKNSVAQRIITTVVTVCQSDATRVDFTLVDRPMRRSVRRISSVVATIIAVPAERSAGDEVSADCNQ